MKKVLISTALTAVSLVAFAGDHYVAGYTKADGTYVPGHMQTDPNSTKLDNYSTKGNVNPYTGQAGTANPYIVQQPKPPADPYKPLKVEPIKPNKF